jgi:hypothetical protein
MSGQSPEYSYVAYIDEAGDPGLRRVRPRSPTGASEWFIVSAALIPADKEAEAASWTADIMGAMNSPQMQDLHFAKLTDNRKALACTMLAERHVRLFSVISNKQNMQGYKNPFAANMTATLPQDNWFYCWMTRVLLERVTDFVAKNSLRKFGDVRKVKLVFSERGGLRYSQMHAYYEWINMKSAGGTVPLFLPWGIVDLRCLHQDLLSVYQHRELPALKMADITASAFFRAVDVHDVPQRNANYAKLLKPRMAADPSSKLISGYGVKLMPNMRTLDKFKVPFEQREIFHFYGYPKQWWQSVVEPGPV